MSASQSPTASIQNDTIQRQANRIKFLENLENVRNRYINQLETRLQDINNVAGPAAEEIKLGGPPIRFRGTPQDLIPILIRGKEYSAMIFTKEMIEDLNQHLHASRGIDALKQVISEEMEIAKMAGNNVKLDEEKWKEDRVERIAKAKVYISGGDDDDESEEWDDYNSDSQKVVDESMARIEDELYPQLYDVLASSNGPRSRINCAVRHILQQNKILESDQKAWNTQLQRILRTFPKERQPRREKIVIDTEVCPFEPNYWKVRRV